jgi:hypothetical protein
MFCAHWIIIGQKLHNVKQENEKYRGWKSFFKVSPADYEKGLEIYLLILGYWPVAHSK